MSGAFFAMAMSDEIHSDAMRQPVAARGPSWFVVLGIWTLVFLMVWSIVGWKQQASIPGRDIEPRSIEPRGDLSSDEQATIGVFRDASPAVVHITSTERRRTLFGLNVFEIPRGTGTGFSESVSVDAAQTGFGSRKHR